MYLFTTDGGAHLTEYVDLEMTKTKMKIATYEWVANDNYYGEHTAGEAEKLYSECLKEKDFGDICQVYEIENDEEFYFLDTGDSIKIKRIY